MHIEDFGRRGGFGRRPPSSSPAPLSPVAFGRRRWTLCQYGFRLVVPREAVGDRNPDVHEANLYDVDAKYGDVVFLEETLEYLEEVNVTRTQ